MSNTQEFILLFLSGASLGLNLWLIFVSIPNRNAYIDYLQEKLRKALDELGSAEQEIHNIIKRNGGGL